MHKQDYSLKFIAFNGPGPWPCYFCGDDVIVDWDGPRTERRGRGNRKDDLAVHHIDHDKNNDDLTNLTATHNGCHARHHQQGTHKGRIRSPETRRKMSEAQKGRKHRSRTDDERAALSLKLQSYYDNRSPEERDTHVIRIQEFHHNDDRSPTFCTCGAGPFKGSFGVSIHKARAQCER